MCGRIASWGHSYRHWQRHAAHGRKPPRACTDGDRTVDVVGCCRHIYFVTSGPVSPSVGVANRSETGLRGRPAPAHVPSNREVRGAADQCPSTHCQESGPLGQEHPREDDSR